MWTFIIDSVEPAENKFTVIFVLLRNGQKHRRDSIIIMSAWLASVPSDERAKFIQQKVDERCREFTAIEDVKVDFSSIIGQTFNVTPNTYKTKAEIEAEIKPVEIMKEIGS
jgi:hypothetical protein